MSQTDRDAAIVRHLAQVVMGWQSSHSDYQRGPWNPLDSWADAGAVWEKAREMGTYRWLSAQPGFQWAMFDPNVEDDLGSQADSGPRAICEAVARATGYEAKEAGDV